MIVENLRIIEYGDYRNNWQDTVQQIHSLQEYMVKYNALTPMKGEVGLFYAEKRALTAKETTACNSTE